MHVPETRFIMRLKNIKQKLMELNDDGEGNTNIMLNSWNEGYITALVDYAVINEDEFDTLIEWFKTGE